MLTRCVVSSEQSIFCARILNPGKCTVSIQKGTVLGLFEPIVYVKQCDVNVRTDASVFHVAESDEVSDNEELHFIFKIHIQREVRICQRHKRESLENFS